MKTEQEKLSICIRFLESRGYSVFSEVMTGVQVARLIGVTSQCVFNWSCIDNKGFRSDFPKPLAVKGRYKANRFLAKDIREWAEKHCEVVYD